MFRDDELAHVYVYDRPVDAAALRLQTEEVERVDWFDLDTLWKVARGRRDLFCVPMESVAVLRHWAEHRPENQNFTRLQAGIQEPHVEN